MKNKKLFAILTLVCFMFTLMPVAAFAADDAVAKFSQFNLVDGQDTVIAEKGKVKFAFAGRDNANEGSALLKAGSYIYVWAVDANGEVTPSVNVTTTNANLTGGQTAPLYVEGFAVNSAIAAAEFELEFVLEGDYTVYAGLGAAGVTKVSDIVKLAGAGTETINVLGANTQAPVYALNVAGATAGTATDNYDWKISDVTPNNVANKYVLTFTKDNKEVMYENVFVETDSANITAALVKDTTSYSGKVEMKLSAAREGEYTVYVTIAGEEFVILVDCTNTSAAYIETVEQPASPIALYTNDTDFAEEVVFEITDINGNAVVGGGSDYVFDQTPGSTANKYLFFVEKPAKSTLKDSNLTLHECGDGEYCLDINGYLDAEGTYTVKAILNNGSMATATWEVKKFQTPVQLIIDTSTDVIELGATIKGELKYVDANGVVKKADDAKLAATGYAVANFSGNQAFNITAKSDEKYVGAAISTTAVSERYDLVATKEFKVADGAVAVAFVDKAADVNVNNKLEWNIVDGSGTKVSLYGVVDTEIKYVVLDKPADAKVSVYDATNPGDLKDKGVGKVALTSNKVGNVTVQVVVKATKDVNGTATNVDDQVKYYTGTQIIAVGTEGVGDVVVMSIGSNEIVINDAKAAIDAAPIVENNRTFVPFRALAEAFGATVAYDEATQAVTAELNGVTVVMTIGSAEYTVNGVAKTADVAPFINGSRTMVPVRFAAEAFGIKVIPTYDENGATADILFNL